jgi:hypothetical protein
MATYNYTAGLGNVGSYQASGTPFVTGGIDATSTHKISFPSVTSWIVVSNVASSVDCKIGFSSLGVTGTNYLLLDGGQISEPLRVKVTEIYLSGGSPVSVMAGLTGIAPNSINNLAVSPSGSNWSGSAAALVG